MCILFVCTFHIFKQCHVATVHLQLNIININIIIIYYYRVRVKINRMQKYLEKNRLLSSLCPGDMYRNIYL